MLVRLSRWKYRNVAYHREFVQQLCPNSMLRPLIVMIAWMSVLYSSNAKTSRLANLILCKFYGRAKCIVRKGHRLKTFLATVVYCTSTVVSLCQQPVFWIWKYGGIHKYVQCKQPWNSLRWLWRYDIRCMNHSKTVKFILHAPNRSFSYKYSICIRVKHFMIRISFDSLKSRV